jgi:Anaphase-promoting complex subunit 5
LNRSLAIAEARGDTLYQVALLGMLSMFYVRDGDFKISLRYAKLSRAVEGIAENSVATALANSIFGRALQFVGEHDTSLAALAASFQYWSDSQQSGEVYLGLDHHILVGIGLARNLWLQGCPAQARQRVKQTVKDAKRKNHPASLGLALSWTPEILLWIGDVQSAGEHAEWLVAHARSHSLGPYLAIGRGYEGAVAIRRGDAEAGIENLRDCLSELHALRYEMFDTGFKLSLVEGLLAIEELGEGLALIDETIRLIEANGDLVHMPEALRVKGRVLRSVPQGQVHDAERCLMLSLDWARRQGARSWEFRTAIDLAALWAAHGQRDRAQAVLQPIFETFVEGLDTADLQAAKHLLASIVGREEALPLRRP